MSKEKQWQTYDAQDPDKFKYKKEVNYAYTYSSGSNYLRPNTLTYPTGSRALTYGYGEASAGTYTSAKVSSQVNRMDRLTFDGTRVTVFTFTGDDRTDTRTYWKGTGGNDTVAATGYTFDAFGRLTRVRARDASETTIVDFQRAYDYNGNPLYTEYGHKTTRSELYGTQTGEDPEGPADALNRLTRYRRGTLDGNKTDLSATVFAQDWHDTQGVLRLDKLGNWDMVRTDTTGGGTFTTETKGHNLANEYTSKNGQSYYDHDDDGNLLDDGTLTFSYDHANHLVKAVRKSDSAVIGQYTYDALGRRVKKVVDNTDTWDATTLFWYDGLRVVEKGALDGNAAYVASHQFVWGLYLDELLVYDFDADSDGDFDAIDEENGDKRYYALQDFIYSTHAVINSSGTVLERYDYQPYGAPTAWSPDYTDPRPLRPDTCPFLFTGQVYDAETGLCGFKLRTLHPKHGRFSERDPVHYLDGMSLYQYALAAPIFSPDPLGLFTVNRVRECQAVRFTTETASWEKDFWVLAVEFKAETRLQVKTCRERCDDCEWVDYVEGKGEVRGSASLKVQVAQIGPITVRLFGKGLVAGETKYSFGGCAGANKLSTCTRYQFSAGLEGCVGGKIARACAVGEGGIRYSKCTGERGSTCLFGRAIVKACFWSRCYEAVVYEHEECSFD